MNTHTIPDKLREKVNRMYSGQDREGVIKALESGKTVYIGGVKLRGVKVDKAAQAAPATPPADAKTSQKLGKDVSK